MEITTEDYKQNEILRFMREATNLSQQEFANSIHKSKDWVRKNEYGITNYYFKDLIESMILRLLLKKKKKLLLINRKK